ncbi:MAG: DNA-formamidopyrimidine glycosylase family protein [Halobacteriota archaeon]|nr:DNA-formamidopyrimidine glycosylase family protein [Halobacteriota archaeon]
MGLELPEIQNLAEQMKPTLKGKTITEITISDRSASLIKQGMCNLDERKDEIIASKIKGVNTKGKWIFLEFDNGKLLLLGEIIGKFLYQEDPSEIPEKYHLLFDFDDGTSLTFQSSLYAFLEVAEKDELSIHRYAGNLGPSPVDNEFTYPFFFPIFYQGMKRRQ